MPTPQQNAEDIAQAVVNKLDAKRSIDDATHSLHHQWIKSQIDKQRKRCELMEKVKAQVMGWGVIGLITSLGVAIIRGFKADS